MKETHISFFSTAMHMPAATVWPMSRMANLPSCGNSFAVSMTIGLVGCTLMMAASPVLMNSGFSATVAPVFGSSFFWISRTVQAT